MERISHVKTKPRGLARFWKSFYYSFAGLKYAYGNEQSLTVHLITSLTCIALGIIESITKIEWLILLFSLFSLLSAELFNTAIEATIDLVTKEFHPLAKIAKDCGSAATFVLAVITCLIMAIIFFPYIF